MTSRPSPLIDEVVLQAPEVRLAATMGSMARSALREILVEASAPGVRSFAVGMPATDLFPVDAMSRAAAAVLERDPRVLQYGVPCPALKRQVVELMRLRGVETREDRVFLTTGSQQAMDLLARMLVDPGAAVVLEDTIYEGVQMVLRPLAPEVVTVPADRHGGIDLDALEATLERGVRPAFLYVIPEGHNPTGVSLDRDRRLRLLDLARRFGFPVLEDDAYGLLRLDDGAAPPLRALDGRRVFYLGSFSKILAPSLRVGWIVLPEEQEFPLSPLKHGTDLDTATFGQAALAEYIASGHLPGHLARLRSEYRRRRDAMLEALARHMPEGVRWRRPEAGIYVWLSLPAGTDATALLRTAIRDERVAFCPGRAFAPGGAPHADHCLRLSYADSTPEEIEEGIARLGRALRSSGRQAAASFALDWQPGMAPVGS